MNANQVNGLLCGEISAIETYQQALEVVGRDTAGALRTIHDEHRSAANTWRKYAHQLGVKPTRRSGMWGMFAMIFEGTATLLGRTATLRALKRGEEYGVKSYQKALRGTCPMDCEQLIRSTLLPQTEAHVAALNHLLASQHN